MTQVVTLSRQIFIAVYVTGKNTLDRSSSSSRLIPHCELASFYTRKKFCSNFVWCRSPTIGTCWLSDGIELHNCI